MSHALTYAGNYFLCAQNGCQRTFSGVWSYKRHIATHIVNDVNEDRGNGSQDDCTGNANVEALDDMVMDDVMDVDDEMGTHETVPNANETILEQLDLFAISSKFISRLRAKPNVPAAALQTVLECTTEMFSEILESLLERTKKVIHDLGGDQNKNEQVADLCRDFTDCFHPFAGLETNWLQVKYFLNAGTYIPPVSIPLGTSFDPQPHKKTGTVHQKQKLDTFEYVPIADTLKEVLKDDVLEGIRAYRTREPDDGVMEDFRDGEFYKTHPVLKDPDSINILLYFDEVETTNPLSPKAGTHKLGMFYYSVKDLHPALQSCLGSKFLLAAVLSRHIKHYGMDAILAPIVHDLKLLESEGISIATSEGEARIRVILGQTTGDNLGLHGLLGFVESFSANHPCRTCSIAREDAQSATTEDVSLLRTKETYEEDLQVDERDSILNQLKSFHVIDNYAFDIMHDLLEGVCLIEVKLTLQALINQELITLDEFNIRLTSFNYGHTEFTNKPCIVTQASLNRPLSATGQKAIQSYFLVRYFPILVGDRVPADNENLLLIKMLLACMDVIFAPSVSLDETDFLARLIDEHHQHFLTLFPERHLLPKHHHMVHYPAAMRAIGPLINFSSLRFEGKHGYFKQIAQITRNFKNIPKTMARRHQMTLSDQLLNNQVLHLKPVECGKGSLAPLVDFAHYQHVIAEEIGVPLQTDLFSASSATSYGVKYRPGMMVALEIDQDGNVQYGKIDYVVVSDELVYVCVQCWQTLWFDDHFHAYAIECSDPSHVECLSVRNLLDYHPYHATKSYVDDNYHYIIPRHR